MRYRIIAQALNPSTDLPSEFVIGEGEMPDELWGSFSDLSPVTFDAVYQEIPYPPCGVCPHPHANHVVNITTLDDESPQTITGGCSACGCRAYEPNPGEQP